jgi:hypothetical protein
VRLDRALFEVHVPKRSDETDDVQHSLGWFRR